jgi:hypothetical protein
VALGAVTSALVAGSSPGPPDRDSVTRWEPVRRALEDGAGPQAHDDPTLAGVRGATREAVRLFRDGGLSDLAGLLPPLLADADALVGAGADGARSERSRIRVIAGSLLVHTWQFDAADRALSLALEDADGPLERLAVAGQQCFALTRQGKLAQCRELAAARAAESEPRLSTASRDDLAAWGGLLLWGAGAAVRDNRPDDADDMTRLARAAAAAAAQADFVPRHAPWHRFGPSVVAVAEAESALILDRPDKTLAIGRRLAPQSRRHARHRLDVAAAHAAMRHYPEAVGVLEELRRAQPQWLPQQRYAGRILATVIGRRRTLSPAMRDLVGYLHLPL